MCINYALYKKLREQYPEVFQFASDVDTQQALEYIHQYLLQARVEVDSMRAGWLMHTSLYGALSRIIEETRHLHDGHVMRGYLEEYLLYGDFERTETGVGKAWDIVNNLIMEISDGNTMNDVDLDDLIERLEKAMIPEADEVTFDAEEAEDEELVEA